MADISPGGRESGRLHIRVLPDVHGFAKRIQALLDKIEQTAKLTIDLDVDAKKFEARIAEVTRDRTAEVVVTAQTKQAADAIRAVTRKRAATLQADADTAKAETQLDRTARTRTATINARVNTGRSRRGGLFSALFGGVIDMAKKAASAVQNLITSALENAFSSASSGIGGFLNSFTNGLAGSVKALGPLLAGLGAVALGLAAVAALAFLAQLAITAMAAVAGAVLAALPLAFAGIAALIISTDDQLKEAFQETGEQIMTSIKGAALPMVDQLAESLDWVGDKLKTGSQMWSDLKGSFEAASKAIQPLAEGLTGLAANLLPGLTEALNSLADSGFFTQVAASLATLGTHIGDFLTTLSTSGTDYAAILNSIVESLGTMLPALGAFLNAWATVSPEFITQIAESVAKLLYQFADPTVMAGIVSLSSAFLALVDITGIVVAAWFGAVGWITDGINTVGAKLSEFAAWLDQQWNELTSLLPTLWSNAWSQVESASADAVLWIQDKLAWFDQLGAMFTGWWNAAYTATRTKIAELVGAVAGLPGQIANALGNLGSLLYNKGRDLVQGLIDGVKSMAGSVTGALGDLFSSLNPFSLAAPDNTVLRGLARTPAPITVQAAQAIGAGPLADLVTVPRSLTLVNKVTNEANIRSLVEKLTMRVYIGEEPVRTMVRTEIDADDRTTARLLGSGAFG